jgi:hypothetical protein
MFLLVICHLLLQIEISPCLGATVGTVGLAQNQFKGLKVKKKEPESPPCTNLCFWPAKKPKPGHDARIKTKNWAR